MRRLIAATIGTVALLAGAVVVAQSPADNPGDTVRHHVVAEGESMWSISQEYGVTYQQVYWANRWVDDPAVLFQGDVLHIPEATVPATTSTLPATTTTATPTTTTVQPTTTTQPPSAGFVETFDGNPDALGRFDTGVFHRDKVIVAMTEWQADHALTGSGDCTGPDQTHTVHRDNPAESFYVCASVDGDASKGHLMTSVGDTSGYSIAWFSPKQVFTDVDFVAWDVNLTNLAARQWWEVVLVPTGDPHLTTKRSISETANVAEYTPGMVALGKGPFGDDGNIYSGGVYRDPFGWNHVSNVDKAAAASKMIRRPFWMRDNHDGTITFQFGFRSDGVTPYLHTYAGEFPDEFRVYFKDHNYTPNKGDTGCGGVCSGYTWHWDNIVVR
jgi:LysM repeat protein